MENARSQTAPTVERRLSGDWQPNEVGFVSFLACRYEWPNPDPEYCGVIYLFLQIGADDPVRRNVGPYCANDLTVS
jgi:hypothetical protein